MTQEALINVRKHAAAHRVEVFLENRDEGFLTRVADDGIGFVPAAQELGRPGHLGLSALHERAEIAGGWCRIESSPGAGTIVEFWLPQAQQGTR